MKKMICWLAQALLGALDFAILIWIGNILNQFHPSCCIHANIHTSEPTEKKNVGFNPSSILRKSFRIWNCADESINNLCDLHLSWNRCTCIRIFYENKESYRFYFSAYQCEYLSFSEEHDVNGWLKCKLIWFVILLARKWEKHTQQQQQRGGPSTGMRDKSHIRCDI